MIISLHNVTKWILDSSSMAKEDMSALIKQQFLTLNKWQVTVNFSGLLSAHTGNKWQGQWDTSNPGFPSKLILF